MINKSILYAGMIIVMMTAAVILPGCDSTQNDVPQFIINVNLDEGTYPISKTNKIYAVFYLNSNWTTPWMTLSSSSNKIMTPELNIGDFPLYFEVWYDADGDGLPTPVTDFYQGWNGVTDRTTPAALTPLPVSETELMMLNFDLENNVSFP